MNPGTVHKKWSKYTQYGDVFVDVKRFKERLEPDGEGCLIWTGACHHQGYGMTGLIRAHDKTRIMGTAHRVAMRMKLNRELTPDERVIHLCNNPKCCHPDHLAIKPTQATRKEQENDQVSV